MSKTHLLLKHSAKIPIGTDGFIRLVDVMGDDNAVVQAARVSYGEGTKTVREDRQLIRYLMRRGHTSPFEQCEIKLHVRVPMDLWRQWIRHRTANVNEYSTRYSIAIDKRNTTLPQEWRLQSTNNKQGSSGFIHYLTDNETIEYCQKANINLTFTDGAKSYGQQLAEYLTSCEKETHKLSTQTYQTAIEAGVAREQARKNLPLSTYTETYWKIDLHNLLHFLRLRLDSHAQLEIRQFADAIAQITKEWVPLTWEAFIDYKLEAVTFSKQELAAIRLLANTDIQSELGTTEGRQALCQYIESKRERAEFLRKIGVI